ncbi:uncharacterized protein PV06_11904 [Exophiala oligosperma]|uniref:RING-type domain-containing protein n=1 Tax=Exophiala oligosperma TaxID=215243 RepID=A0A0D2BE26_9EURO|nr:uncharacterized protein PV06_11904 [Exophiala oligosperma]KIW35757.1 hypothetical protein PV06_11904 [Exophiala oligosperma]
MECLCCYEDVELYQTVCCDSKTPHFFCFNCMNRHFLAQLKNNNIDMRCIYTNACDSSFDERDVYRFMDEDTLSYYNRVKDQRDVRDAIKDKIVTCPFCSIDMVDERTSNITYLECVNPSCLEVSCTKCKKQYHPGVKCDSTTKERTLKEETETYKVIKSCPSCSRDIERESGCSHMKCICGTTFCYVCGENISKDVWGHGCKVFDQPRRSRLVVRRDVHPNIGERSVGYERRVHAETIEENYRRRQREADEYYRQTVQESDERYARAQEETERYYGERIARIDAEIARLNTRVALGEVTRSTLSHLRTRYNATDPVSLYSGARKPLHTETRAASRGLTYDAQRLPVVRHRQEAPPLRRTGRMPHDDPRTGYNSPYIKRSGWN